MQQQQQQAYPQPATHQQQQQQQPLQPQYQHQPAQKQPQHEQRIHHQHQGSVTRVTKGKYSLGDFDILRTLGTGSFGRVHLVQSKHNQRFYAIKVLKKAQVVKMKQVEHTNDERRMLSDVKHPFLITLWGTFQDWKNLYMVMDFVEGGELFSLLRKSGVSAHGALQMESSEGCSSVLTYHTAFPQPRCQILCCRGYPGTRVLAFKEYHLPILEAREPAAGSAWAPQNH
jgi:protein kinase A